jgi:hypothetical protein
MIQRRAIPKAVRDQVLTEYKHRCAMCGEAHPQLHHIDEDPSNNDPLNLIPLCPNCHLTGQHNPHQALDTDKLRFFRIHKHPLILKAQFHPLFTRLRFLDEAEIQEIRQLTSSAEELVHLVEMHVMGAFYAKQINELVRMRSPSRITVIGDPGSERRRAQSIQEDHQRYRIQLTHVRDRVHELVVEMLAYQTW